MLILIYWCLLLPCFRIFFNTLTDKVNSFHLPWALSVVQDAQKAHVSVFCHQVVSRLHEFKKRYVCCKDVGSLIFEFIFKNFWNERNRFACLFGDGWPQIEELLRQWLSDLAEKLVYLLHAKELIGDKYLLDGLYSLESLIPIVF